MSYCCRLAPSPTGRMHAGNIFSSLVSWLMAKTSGGEVVLRIEDLDSQRSKPEYIEQIQRDYELLGLLWDKGPYFQTNNTNSYFQGFNELSSKGLVYPCFCSRSDLLASSAPHEGCEPIYAGTCRSLSTSEQELNYQALLMAGKKGPSYRVKVPDKDVTIYDLVYGNTTYNLATDSGDFIVRRSDGLYAYQLAVVVDDYAQGIDLVVRGNDLLSSSCRQRYLQDVLAYPHVEYAHVPLFVAPDGRRLAKRNHDAHLGSLLERFKSPEAILGKISYISGIIDKDEPVSINELVREFDIEVCKTFWCHQKAITWPCT